jgi:hypothetical protein
MKRCFGLAAFAGLVVVVCAADGPSQEGKKAKANDGIVTDWGKPTAYEPGKITAVWVWHDDGTWYFRTTGGDKKPHKFQGTIEVVGGKLLDLRGKKGEYGSKYPDRYVFTPSAIAFDFETADGVDGLNFAVDAGAAGLKFTVAIDGEASPKHVRIGKASDHPAAAVFTLPAHPPEVKPKKK